ncbi:MAG: cytochrome c3 family protein [Actinobacteria bacterium]|nr:cytochrome c3 family protein [Actinomycetota bacterium]
MLDFTQVITSAFSWLSKHASPVVQPLRRILGRIPFAPIGIGLLVAVALSQLIFVVQAATQVGCEVCHIPSRATGGLAKTPHRDVPCLKCHQSGDYLSLLEADIQAGQNLMVQLVPWRNPDSSRASVPDARCLECHAKQLASGVVEANNVRMRHSDILAAGTTCDECHPDTGHGVSPVASSLGHATCSACHDGTTAGIECTICHVQQPPREVAKLPPGEALTHTALNGTLHGMGDLTGCPMCHARSSCAGCHKIPLPHDPNTFPFTHGTDAIANPDACISCHKQAFCDSCHQMPMPHPATYLATHVNSTSPRDEAICLRCHVAEDCTRCHDAHVHSPLPPDVVDRLRQGLTTTTTATTGAVTTTTGAG